MGSRIVVMKDGIHAAAVSTPQDLYQTTRRTCSLRTFIGSPSMNKLEHSKLSEKDGHTYITFGNETRTQPFSCPTP